jgi:hypothetical protein
MRNSGTWSLRVSATTISRSSKLLAAVAVTAGVVQPNPLMAAWLASQRAENQLLGESPLVHWEATV